MRVTPLYLKAPSGKYVRRYLASGNVGRVYFSVVGHTHAYAIHKAFKEIMRPF